MKITGAREVMDEYMRDESKRTGFCDRIFFPEGERDVCRILSEDPQVPVTLQGARTGVTGGCVPDGGIAVNFERMNRVLDLTRNENGGGTITVQPGILLQTLRSFIRPHGLFFPPDPTETTASLGGMVACNSSGARSFRYGSIRNYVLALDVILPGGDKLQLSRGREKSRQNHFHLCTCSGKNIRGDLPDLTMPAVEKHTAGYYIRPDMDLIDLFIGAEGTLGIITSITLRLLPQKRHTWGGVMFLPDEDSALKLVRLLREEKPSTGKSSHSALSPEALEFFGADTLDLLRQAQHRGEILTEMEQLRPDACCAVYTEYAANDRQPLIEAFQYACDMLGSTGGDPYRTWAAINTYHMEKLHRFRHAAPECINQKISDRKKQYPAITKLGTDMSVPDRCLESVFSLYRDGLAKEKLQSAIFGHIGNNHLHVNVLPQNMDEFHRCKAMFEGWAKEIVAMGGSVSAEHGIGKIKVPLLQKLYTEKQLAAMADVKKCFDPQLVLNRGNVFPASALQG